MFTIQSYNVENTRIKPAPGNSKWETTDDVSITHGSQIIVIPTGTISNFASIPVLLRGLLMTNRPSQCVPAIVHDALVGEFGPRIGGDYNLSWADCADIFEALLKQMGEKNWRTFFLVLGVRLWGKLARK